MHRKSSKHRASGNGRRELFIKPGKAGALVGGERHLAFFRFCRRKHKSSDPDHRAFDSVVQYNVFHDGLLTDLSNDVCGLQQSVSREPLLHTCL